MKGQHRAKGGIPHLGRTVSALTQVERTNSTSRSASVKLAGLRIDEAANGFFDTERRLHRAGRAGFTPNRTTTRDPFGGAQGESDETGLAPRRVTETIPGRAGKK